ncbi:MAG TPA: response regulator transcription factor [Armatimonadota bacterium]|nr:response regulator transcription factor [Armatimonadota bacterium]HPP74625.1 response regulator transcription factor [Armatimonadota bacterium]
MRKGKILVIDDDEDILRLVGGALKSRGFEVLTASTGTDGLELCTAEQPDLVVLDIELPDRDGIEVCQEIRKTNVVPIVFLTVRGDETDVVLGLGVGGDYYQTKPFKISELVARIEAALRRELVYAERKKLRKVLQIKNLSLDLSAFELRKDGEPIKLTATEFKLFKALAEHPDQVFSRDQLLDYVWDLRAEGIYTRTVDVHIGRLRKKIENNPSEPEYIVTVAGLGYKMPSL